MKIIMENMGKVIRAVHGIRITGAAALNMCMVALGGADIYYEFGPHAWDMAAADIIGEWDTFMRHFWTLRNYNDISIQFVRLAELRWTLLEVLWI